ncbi:LysM peptidoglycan-binding domain-containing M23 family metallopeptidase [Duganella sp. HH101]|uniref:LysM peptidoglycan-binding domain-containing M23 family metallopeptidase n=1 Tax=Duganella sp. HH101 TaxID=1781066 RepID=UPI0008742D5A|nr:LysM peptidoglycan-binding domain-containing M23 family metallopeptidase [Duganella sp. HH101]OFA03663.1 peptidase family M23 [Duganella sp. HH101]
MEQYTVAKHDTLWKIAREHGVTVQALASANHLKGKQLHLIHEGQLLLIPGAEGAATPDTQVKLKFRGLDFKGVTPKRVKVAYDGREEEHALNGNSLSLGILDHARGLKVWVEDLCKKMEPVLDLEILPIGQWNLHLDSRQVKVDGALQNKRGTPTSSADAVRQSTTNNAQLAKGQTAQEQTRVEAGKPVQGVATIYTEANLRLQAGNEPFRRYLIDAAKAHDLTPQSLAAMIHAEAAKIEGVWQEKSNQSSPSKAQGLTQFFGAAWKDVYADPSSLLYKDGQKWSETQLLAKRLEARYAIDAAATYAKLNLKNFAKKTKFNVDGLPPEDKAKLAYLLHHEGLKGALRLVGIGDQLSRDDAQDLLEQQLGTSKASKKKVAELLEQYNDDPRAAYKGWLLGYTDAKINVNNFVVQDKEKFLKAPRTAAAILSALASQPMPAQPKPKATAAATTKNPPATKQGTATTKQVPAGASPPASAAGAPATGASATTTTGATAGNGAKWHDPLAVCTLRTAHLASKTGAKFGWTREGGKRCHQGIDLLADPGTEIFAVANGVVHTSKAPNASYAYGDTLVLEVGIDDLPPAQAAVFRKVNPGAKTIGFFYAHLSEMPKKTKTKVYAGDPIGRSGCSGNAKAMKSIALGAHLHFEVRKDALKKCGGLDNRVDPLLFIQNCTNNP